jgi:uncharacterized repeat protein (TIGR03806 family)
MDRPRMTRSLTGTRPRNRTSMEAVKRRGRYSPSPCLLAAVLILGVIGGRDSEASGPHGLSRRPEPRAFLNLPTDEHGVIPALLSQTGAFRDTPALSPMPGLIPYGLNAPFWSDGAAKRRWISVPHGGPVGNRRIQFAPVGEWTFPPGTVFVKHFELATDETRPGATRRLETRLLVVDSRGGVYGVGYRWRADGSDADLVKGGRSEPIAIRTASGTRTQNWYYPGPADCRLCHTPAAGGVLGVKARQLNRDFADPTGSTENQLRAWDYLGLFEPRPAEAEFPHIARLARLDDPARSLEDRARSFLDANCSHCHRPGGAAADFDARYDTSLAEQKLLGEPVRINLGIDGARFIAPNDPWRSIVLARVETLEPTEMPPLAHEVIDLQAVAVLRAWIRSLPGPPVMAPPTILPRGGDYRESVRVAIRHDDPAAVIRYTLDGAAPGKSSPQYAGPFEVARSTTVRARAYKPGHTRSIAVQETLIFDE